MLPSSLLSRLVVLPVIGLTVIAAGMSAAHQAPWWAVSGTVLMGLGTLGGIVRLQRRTRFDSGGAALDLDDADYRAVIASLHDGIVVQLADTRIVANNLAAERVLGLTGDQMRGRTSLDPRWRTIHEDGSPFPGETHPSMVALRTGQPVVDVLMGVHRPEAGLAWIRINAQPLGTPPRAVVCSFADITAERQVENELRALSALQHGILDAANVAIIATTMDGVISHWNATAVRLLQWTEAEVIGRQTPAILHEPQEVVARAVELSRELGLPIVPGFDSFVAKARIQNVPDEHEWTYIRKDGSRFPVLLSVTALRSDDGTLTGYLGVAADISERRRAHEELIRAKEAAEAATRAKSEFLAIMSHEIRTPMNGIIGMVEMLGMGNLAPDQREYLETIDGCAESLLTLINDILDFSKIESGHLVLESLAIDPRVLVEEVATLFAGRAQAKGLELVCQIDDLVPDLIETDPARLRQVLVNLLSNAVKFTERGEIVIRLGWTDDQLTFAISDTGIGIADETLGRLFQPFSQADASTTRRFGGTGLGLVISRRLCELMGGDILVDSAVGRGSTFRVSLPAEGSSCVMSGERPLAGRRILCAEAHPLVRMVVRQVLMAGGAQVEQVVNGAEALRLVRERQVAGQPYDLVLADRRSPELDGLHLAAALRALPLSPPLPLLLTSTLAERLSESELEQHGIRGCVLRPIRRQALLDAVATALGRSVPALPVVPHLPQLKARVLVAEDNPVNQRVVQALLARLGVQVQIVQDGGDALAARTHGPWDLVLMDCQMPGLDGFEATRSWRRDEGSSGARRVPIIALTANALAGDRELCLEAGMDDYLAKPIRLESLLAMFQKWLTADPVA